MVSTVIRFGEPPHAQTPQPAIPGYPYAEVEGARPGAAFVTTRAGVLRTVGLICLCPKRAPKLEQWGAADAQTVSRLLDPFPEECAAAARGKMVFVETGQGGRDRALCYQVKGNAAEPVWCGNSMAGTSAVLALLHGREDLLFDVLSQNVPAAETAQVTQRGHRFAVTQQWAIERRVPVLQERMGPFAAARCNLLNPYLVLDAPVTTPVHDVYQAFAAEHGLDAKLLLLDRSTARTSAHFYNLNGRHGAAPMTGLVTLGYLRTQVEWIADALKTNEIITPSGNEIVPRVEFAGATGIVAQLPDVEVELHSLGFSLR